MQTALPPNPMVGHTLFVPQNSDIFVNVMNYISYGSTILNVSNFTGQRTPMSSGEYKHRIKIDYLNR